MENTYQSNNTSLSFLYKFYHLDKQLREIPPPYSGLDFAVKDMKTHLAIMVKEEQVMSFNAEQQVSIMEWLQRLRTTVESCGIRCELMGRKNRGN